MGNRTIEIRTDLGVFDLFQGVEDSFYITRQIHDLQNFETRNADFSKTVRVPPTPQNITILDAFVGVENRQSIPCRIIMGGVTVAPKARLLFTKSTTNNKTIGYDVTILYGNFNLFEDIVEGTIDQMNWADLQYLHTFQNYVDMSANLTGICTPIVDWVTRNSGNVYPLTDNVEINTGGFFVYAVEVINRILGEAGYTATYENVPAEFHQVALACPVTKFFELASTDQISFSSLREKTIDTTASNAIVRVTFNLYVAGVQSLWNNVASQWEIDTAGEVTVEVRGTYTYTEIGVRLPSNITIFHNGAPIDTIAIDTPATDVDFFLTAPITVAIGDIIYCEVETTEIQTSLTVNTLTNFSIATQGAAADRSIQPSNYIPQIDKSSFIANILKLYNVVMETDDITNTVNFTSFNDVFTGVEQDLTNILDVGDVEITKVSSIGSLGQISRFEWQNDNLLRRDMDFDLKFNNQQLAKEVTTISMDFSACDESIYLFLSGDTGPRKAKIPNCNIVKDTQSGNTTATVQADGSYVLSAEESFQAGQWVEMRFGGNSHTHRVVQVDSLSTGIFQTPIFATIINEPTTVVYSIFSGEAGSPEQRLAVLQGPSYLAGAIDAVDGALYGSTGNAARFPTEALSAHFSDSMLWSNIVEGEYKQILDALQTPQVINAWFNLDVAIFNEIDFLRPVYIKEFNAFYYLNKIEQFKLGRKTRLELIRISTLT